MTAFQSGEIHASNRFRESYGVSRRFPLSSWRSSFLNARGAPAEFRDFVLHADRKDAGEAAARDCLGVQLSDLVSAFLGPGEWAPRFKIGESSSEAMSRS